MSTIDQAVAAPAPKRMTHAEWFREHERLTQQLRDALSEVASLASIMVSDDTWNGRADYREITREQIKRALAKVADIRTARTAHCDVEAEG